MGCRVAELLRANPGAKQTRPKPQRRVGLAGLCLFLSWLKNTREFFQPEPATMLIAKGSRVFVSRLLVLSQFAPMNHRRARGLWRVRAPRPGTQRRHSGTDPPLTPPAVANFLPASRADSCKARVAACEHGEGRAARRPCMGRARCYFPWRRLGGLSLFLGEYPFGYLEAHPSGANGQRRLLQTQTCAAGRVGRT
jgi:hypothetical protein